MEQNQINKKKGNWSNAFIYVIWASSVLSGTILIVLSIISLNGFDIFKLFDFLLLFILSYCYWTLIIAVIALISSTVIGIPVVLVLKKLNIDNPINAAIIGALSAFIFLMIVSKGQVNWFYSIFLISGFVCGYAFMFGYKMEKKS